MSEPVRIVAIVEGGVLQSILTAGVAVECVTVDYDTGSGDEDSEFIQVPQENGRTELASVSEPYAAEVAGPFVMAAFERFQAPNAEPYSYADILERYDSGEISDAEAIAELQTRGWSERRAYVILAQHQGN
jgi:hypothetical protein